MKRTARFEGGTDEDSASIPQSAPTDDRLDGIEVAIRAIAREKFPQYEIPEYKSDDPRHKKRNQAPKHLEPEFFPPEREVD